MKRRAVFLDRDGVINRAWVREGKPYPPDSSQKLEILEGVTEGLAELKKRGYLLILVTNQPDVSRGTLSRETLQQRHRHLQHELCLDAVFACCHDDRDDCDCRKPRPGLLLRAALEFDIDLPRSFMIGDRWRDMEAGYRAGCSTIFIDYQYAERQPDSFKYRVGALPEACTLILAEPEPT